MTSPERPAPTHRTSGYFIVTPNRVDVLSLMGLGAALYSLALMVDRQYDRSVAFLLLAMAIDFVDGPLARRYGLLRDFGRYLDGSIDVIVYLIAPSLMLYLSGFSRWYCLAALGLFVASGIVRLSVFNQIGNVRTAAGRSAYLGMPVFWSVFALAAFQVWTWFQSPAAAFPFIVLALLTYSVLMQYRATFFKFQSGWAPAGAMLLMSGIFLAASAIRP